MLYGVQSIKVQYDRSMRNSSDSSRRTQRLLEILPGFVSWNLILFPVWGAFAAPLLVAYFILAFDIFWLYKSVAIAVTSVITHLRIQAAEKLDWLREVHQFPDWQQVRHLILITTYKEPLHTLQRTLRALAKQTYPKDKLLVILAFEQREDPAIRETKVAALTQEFGRAFGELFITVHTDKAGETVGKHSNARSAIFQVRPQLKKKGINFHYLTVSSCDADHVYHPQHFAYLTYNFLDSPERYFRIWQAAIQFYNNFWKLPALSRVANTIGSVWNTALLSRTDRMINQQNYSISWDLLASIDFWDPEVIPEDYRVFFKAFFATKGRVEVEPIYLPLYADAAESTSFLKTMRNQYEQFKRWAWGVSDDPYIIKNFFRSKTISFSNKLIRVLRIIEDHFLWPVNWFLITIGINIVTFLNPSFSRTVIGYNLPRISSAIMTICLIFLAVLLWVDSRQRPPRPAFVSRFRAALLPLEFFLMPVAGFIFNALPGLDAHTRLMLGKYLEYRVTEKV
jgi:cellulose synthase/poly-beta-1,6-N-acetylglucosamine synthase-like glycosyltransferase